MNIMEFLKNNFLHVAPILVAGAIALAIALERIKALYFSYPIRNMSGFFQKIQDLVFSGKTTEALGFCEQYSNKPAAKLVKTALMRAHLPEDSIQHGIEMTLGETIKAIQQRTGFLATIANVTTLLGLLGTIAGLIHSFEAVGHADPQQKSQLLAAGIATAMNATMLGLGVAIPCMVLFSVLINKTNRLISDLEDSAVRTLDMIKLRYYQGSAATVEGEARRVS